MRFSRFLSSLTGLTIMASVSTVPLSAEPDSTFKPVYNPTIHVTSLEGSIEIDGDLTDSGWRTAARADNFVENNPGDQIKPPVESAALITYDASNLYVALIAYDDPTEIRVSMCDRDNIFRDDYFGLMLDTYGDRTWGYEIFVNPLGIQGDLRMLASGMEDMSLDLVFESIGKVTDSGYQVELAIPFASLRFANKSEQTWRLNLWRDRQREMRSRYSWAALDRDDPCFMCSWGTMTGIRDIKPGSNLDILPNVIGFQSGEAVEPDNPNSDFDNSNPDAELSINVRYGVSSNSSLELTVNPDFSQVESDAGQIDVNQTFALYYPERRPFFQEGSDLFDTYMDVIHTRSINDPSAAAKFTGQFGRFSMAYLLARDDKSPLTVPLQQQSAVVGMDQSWVNILRTRQTFWEDSHIGLTLTDRRSDDFVDNDDEIQGGSGSVYGVDGMIRLRRNYHIELQVMGSHTVEPSMEPSAPNLIDTTQENGTAQALFDYGRRTVALDGESFDGQAIYASLERHGRTFWCDFDYREFSPTFRAENGYVTQSDRRSFHLNTGLFFRPNREWLVNWEPSINIGRVFDHNATIDLDPASFRKGTIDEWIWTNLYFELKGQTNINIQYLQSRERFSGTLFQGISRAVINVNTRPSALLSCGFNLVYGKSIFRQRFRQWEEVIPLDERTSPDDSIRTVTLKPELGMGTDLYLWADFKLSQRLRLSPEFNFSKMDHRDGYLEAHPDDGREIFSGYIFRTQLNYQFTRELFLRLIVEYNDFSERLAVEPLITYRLNPFTVFYAGVNGNYQRFNRDNYDELTDSRWKLSQRQFFAKLQYLFRI